MLWVAAARRHQKNDQCQERVDLSWLNVQPLSGLTDRSYQGFREHQPLAANNSGNYFGFVGRNRLPDFTKLQET